MNILLNTTKFSLLVLLIFIGLAVINLSMEAQMDQRQSDKCKMLYGFIAKTGDNLAEKYGMSLSATGGGATKEEGIWLMSPSFDRYGDPLTENEARKLIIQCVNDFLVAVNNDQQIRPFLKDYPFTAKNLDLTIFNFDKNQNLHHFPDIAIVTNSKGEIGFLTKGPSTKYGYQTEKYETYEEAIAILAGENKANSFNINK